jgi:ribonuclease HI
MVEYKSYIIGLKAALELKVEKLDVYKDSILYDKWKSNAKLKITN